MTDALRYVEEQQKFDQAKSAVAKNVFIEGYGGALKEIEQCDYGDGQFEYKHKLRHVEWDRLFYDPHSRALDFSDAKYKGIVAWLDLDDALAAHPDAADAINAALSRDIGEPGSTTEDTPRKWVDRKRKRVKIVEMYFRIGQDWYRSTFTQGADLEPPTKTEFLDEKKRRSLCPLVMTSCYVDQEGNRYGVVRQLISPQDEINKRASKALHLLSVNQAFGSEGSVENETEFAKALGRPDGTYFGMEPGWKQRGDVEIIRGGDLAQGHIALMQQSIADIDSVGPSAANMPELPDSASGRAFLARQQAAAQEMGTAFDSLRSFTLSVFELDYYCIRQWWTEEMWLRVSDDQELTGYRFVALNREMTRGERFAELQQKGAPLPKALEAAAGHYTPIIMTAVQKQQAELMQRAQMLGQPAPQGDDVVLQMIASHPLMAEAIKENDVESLLMDIVIDEAPETAVLAQEEFQTLTDLLPTVVQARPDMAPKMVELVIKASQLPNKRELLEQMTKGPDPQQLQMQQAAQALQMEGVKAGIEVQKSQAALNQARAAGEQAKPQIAGAEMQLERERLAQSGAKVPSEIAKNEAQAMSQAASAGERIGGGFAPPQEGVF